MLALNSTQIAQASNYLSGAVNAIIRKRPFLGMLDRVGRVNRNFEGKDMNWLLKYRALVAEPYVPFQDFDFKDTNLHLPLAINPVFWSVPSALDITQRMMNSGPSALINQFNDRMKECCEAMEITTATGMYNDANSAVAGSGSQYLTGLGTFAHRSHTLTPTNADRIAAPDETVSYGGQSIGLGTHGGQWSSSTIAGQDRMSSVLGTDWPDGVSSPDQRYDVSAPRLYNEKTNQWANAGSAVGDSNWRTNCIPMLSRAGTDLAQISVGSMMPNIHLSGSGRHQDVKDAMRTSFRYTMAPNGQSANLGYPEVIEFEGAGLAQDAACPPQYTFSVCYKSCQADFYGADTVNEQASAQQQTAGETTVTGGIYVLLGPQRDPRSGATLFLVFAGGQVRWTPRYVTIHGNWVNNG